MAEIIVQSHRLQTPDLDANEKNLVMKTIPKTAQQKLEIGMDFLERTFQISDEIKNSFSFNKEELESGVEISVEERTKRIQRHAISVISTLCMAAKYCCYHKEEDVSEFGEYNGVLKKLGHTHRERVPVWFEPKHWDASYSFVLDALERHLKSKHNGFKLKESEQRDALQIWDVIMRFMMENLKHGWAVGVTEEPTDNPEDEFADCVE